MTAFGDRAFTEILRLNEVLRVGWQSRITGLIIRRDSTDAPTQRRAREDATRRLPSGVQRGASGETKPATTLILDLQPPEW